MIADPCAARRRCAEPLATGRRPLRRTGALLAAAGSLLGAAVLAAAQEPATGPQRKPGDAPAAELPRELRLVIGRWCPFVCADQGERKGFVTEIGLAIFREHGIRVALVEAPYARAIELVRRGGADAIVLTGEDAPDLIYPSLEQGQTRVTFFVKAGSPWRYTAPSSLGPLRHIGIVQTYDYLELTDYIASHPAQFDRIAGDEPIPRSIGKLLAGRLDAFICDDVVTGFELRRLGKAAAVVPAGALARASRVYIGFSPARPASAQLAALVDRGTRALRASGELARILARYGVTDWRSGD